MQILKCFTNFSQKQENKISIKIVKGIEQTVKENKKKPKASIINRKKAKNNKKKKKRKDTEFWSAYLWS